MFFCFWFVWTQCLFVDANPCQISLFKSERIIELKYAKLKQGERIYYGVFNLTLNHYQVEDLGEKLIQYKAQFIRFDEDKSGDIDELELKRMLEK